MTTETNTGAVRLQLKADVARRLVEHADSESPRECCGLLAGRNGTIERSYPLPNVSETPETRYFAKPESLLEAIQAIRARELDLLGTYHSHPASPPIPSPRDIENAYYPESAYFIIGPKGDEPRIRAFFIEDGKVEPVEVKERHG
jgi:proteasome lid subunit RPN8/RPN11